MQYDINDAMPAAIPEDGPFESNHTAYSAEYKAQMTNSVPQRLLFTQELVS